MKETLIESGITEKELKVVSRVLKWFNFFMAPLVFMTLWNWFVVGFGVPHLTYIWSMGVLLTLDYIGFHASYINDKIFDDDSYYMFAISFTNTLTMLTMWVFAFVIQLFM